MSLIQTESTFTFDRNPHDHIFDGLRRFRVLDGAVVVQEGRLPVFTDRMKHPNGTYYDLAGTERENLTVIFQRR